MGGRVVQFVFETVNTRGGNWKGGEWPESRSKKRTGSGVTREGNGKPLTEGRYPGASGGEVIHLAACGQRGTPRGKRSKDDWGKRLLIARL